MTDYNMPQQVKFPLPEDLKSHLIHCIKTNAKKDQGYTSIKLTLAQAAIYQPRRTGVGGINHNSNDFDTIVTILNEKISNIMGKRYKVFDDLWGLYYTAGDYCNPHDHATPEVDLSAILYLEASDPFSGSLYFPELDYYLDPIPETLVIFDNRLKHGVLTSEGESRVCIAMNLHEV